MTTCWNITALMHPITCCLKYKNNLKLLGLYPYTLISMQSHIVQYVKYTEKIKIFKRNCKIVGQIASFGTKKSKNTKTQNKNSNIKSLDGARVGTGTSHTQSRSMPYLCTTESTGIINCNQAI